MVVLSREELAAGQLKTKLHKEKFRLKVEKEMTERAPKGLFWRVPEYTESTSTKFEYRVTSDFWGNFLKEKFEIITTTTWRHNGDERYVVFKTEEREKKLKCLKSDEKHFNSARCIHIQKYHPSVNMLEPYVLSEKDQLAAARFERAPPSFNDIILLLNSLYSSVLNLSPIFC